jgi:hypothetical protein
LWDLPPVHALWDFPSVHALWDFPSVHASICLQCPGECWIAHVDHPGVLQSAFNARVSVGLRMWIIPVSLNLPSMPG